MVNTICAANGVGTTYLYGTYEPLPGLSENYVVLLRFRCSIFVNRVCPCLFPPFTMMLFLSNHVYTFIMSDLPYIDITDVLLKLHPCYSNPKILYGKVVNVV